MNGIFYVRLNYHKISVPFSFTNVLMLKFEFYLDRIHNYFQVCRTSKYIHNIFDTRQSHQNEFLFCFMTLRFFITEKVFIGKRQMISCGKLIIKDSE